MTSTINILAICGSTKATSSNLNLIYAIKKLMPQNVHIEIFNELLDIPAFSPDLVIDIPPKAIKSFRNKIKSSNGVLICTPEYAMGVPGTLKNALDWTVSSMEFSKKPVALITASSIGNKGHAALLETLRVIECDLSERTQLIISFIATKVNKEATITDEETLVWVKNLIESFIGQVLKSISEA